MTLKIQQPANYVLTLRTRPGADGIHPLRRLLKISGRQCGLHCIVVHDQPHQTNQEINMSNTNELLRAFVATTRSRGGFGVPLAMLDGNDGKWTAGKKGIDIKGRHLAAVTTDVMHGHQKFVDKKPIYSVGRVADGFVPDRDKLGDLDEDLWFKKKDPWQSVVFLPLFDPETHEVFLFTSANNGGRDAVGALVDATLDNAELHPEDADKLPLVELGVDSYENSHGKTIYFPLFDILGFVEMPASILRIKPPPLAIEDKTVETIASANDVEADAAPAALPTKQKRKTKPALVSGRGDMDDEIPF